MSRPKRRRLVQFTPELEAEFEKRVKDYLTTSNHSTLVSRGRKQNKHLKKRSEEGAARTAALAKAHPVLNTLGLAAGAIPFAVAAAPVAVGGGELLGTALANPYVDAGLTSVFGAHGLNHAINEGITDWKDGVMTALEVTPLGRLARPVWNAGRNNFGLLKDNAKAFYNNLTMDLNSVPGRFYHGSPSRTIEEFIPGDSGGIYFTPTKRAARGYTGSLGTGRVYEANLNLGDSPVVVDAGGKAWSAIPEEAVAKAFGMPKEEIYEQIGHYNAGAEPWYSDFLKPFGYNPNTRSYAVDQIVTLGKDLGKSSLTIKGAKDNGKGLFGWRQLPYDQTVVYHPEQVSLLEKAAPQITAENAASITPEQWTAAQDAAIARGDMAEAQRLRDLHFKVSAPNTKVVDTKGNPQLVIHKTPNNFTVFDNSRSIGNLNWAATPKAFEGENGVFATGAGPNPKDMPLYVNMRNPHYPTIEEGMEPAFINEGEDGILGIVDKDMTDYFESSSKAGEGFHMSLGVDNPYALKSADAVTYDNNGVRIPLGERDNFKLNDIRYGLFPFLGLGTVSALYSKKRGGKLTINNVKI